MFISEGRAHYATREKSGQIARQLTTCEGWTVAHIFLTYTGSTSRVKPPRDSLTRQGHKVYSIADFDYSTPKALRSLSEFDVVVAVWSEGADRDDGFVAIATEASRLERLISLRARGSQPMPCRNRSVDRLRCWSLTATGLPPASLRYRKALAGRFSPPIRPERAMGRWRHQTPRPTALTRYSLQRPKEQSQPPSQATSTQSAVEAEAGRLVHKIRPNVGRRAGARGSPPWP
jgi:hypothetical protein